MNENISQPDRGHGRDHLRVNDRRFKIHRLIANQTFPDTKQLAALLEVDLRTVRRDIAGMRAHLNAPIEYNHSKNGYFYTHQNWEMPLVPLNDAEVLSFFMAILTLQATGSTYEEKRLQRAIAKIATSLPEAVSDNLRYLFESVSFQSAPHVPASGEILDRLYHSISELRTVEFEYFSPNSGELKHRKVNPLLLHNNEGDWYLIAFDHLRHDFRDFHAGRITNLQTTNEFFEPPKKWNRDEYFSGGFRMYRGGRKCKVEIVFDKYQAQWMRERTSFHPLEQREELAGGCLKLSFPVGEHGLEAVARFCLQYAGNVEVVKPEKLRKIIMEKLQQGLNLHNE